MTLINKLIDQAKNPNGFVGSFMFEDHESCSY